MSLAGAFDLHVHAGPDVRPRKTSAFELARSAQAAEMAGFLIKHHHCSTVPLAATLSEAFPGLRVYGGLVLNYAVGGFNSEAVWAALEMGAKQIWMPTLDSANERRHRGREGGLSVLDCDVREILRLVAEKDAILGTGHLSPGETAVLVRQAKAAGVRKIVVTHPEIEFVNMPVEMQKELAAQGVYFERCYARNGFVRDWDSLAWVIREVGIESTVLGTDLGQPDNPHPISGLETMLAKLPISGKAALSLL